ncbi:MAG: acyltransferase [Actinobacteria bacterium HGW-Actinobacteria-2]|nr:MAG: acyltransferase [Actinobacteria bacterium HGW-Actinobacteria-2]
MTTAGNQTGSEPRRTQIRQLTGVRAVAALWVLSFHFRPEIVQSWPALGIFAPLMNVGHLGVDLFFVLSGYILAVTHMDTISKPWSMKSALGFLWLRISRVWPAATFSLLIWAVYLAARAVAGSPDAAAGLNPARLLQHVLLIQAWSTDHHDWNPVDWSVSAEWMAYIFFAVTVSVFAGLARNTKPLTRLGLAGLALIPIVAFGVSLQDGSDLLWNGEDLIPGAVALRVLTEFSAGVLLSTITSSLAQRRAAKLPLATIVLTLAVAALYLLARFDYRPDYRFGKDWIINGTRLWGPSESAVIIPLLALLILTLAACPRDPLARWLSTRPLVWLGKVSFSIYLVHWLALDLLRRIVGVMGIPATANLTYQVMTVTAVAAAIVAGWLLWRFVEEPSRRTLRQFLPADIRV